ncbi:hypothetical protein BVRB_5g108980 [Beta vulgaris subsp. vulgaris]|nr:hypothetical protein BVRB_5g108980 [Beta vulgaris subsp. vulgaris]
MFRLRKKSMERFYTFSALTYERLTLEFLASLERREVEGHEGEYEISFQLFNQPQCISLARLNQIFQCDASNAIRNPETWQYPVFYQRDVFWRDITGYAPFDPKTSYSSHMHSPIHSYIHRLLVTVIYSKKEPSKVASEEVSALYIAVHHPEEFLLGKIQDNANGSLEVIYNGSTEVSDHVGKPKKLPVRRNVRTKQLKEVTESSVVVENQVSEVIKEKNSATKVTDDVNDDLNNDRIETHIKTFVFTGMDGLDIELAYQPCILR